MSKNLIMGTMDDNFINTLSTYCVNTRKVAALRKDAKEKIKAEEADKQKVIDEREALIKAGTNFAESEYSVVKYDNNIRKIQDDLKKECAPLNKARRELVKDLDIQDLYAAYAVGVASKNYSAVGTTVRHGKKKDTIITNKKGFNNQLSKWFTAQGIQNAENESAVRKFTEKYIAPFIGAKLNKEVATNEAYSSSQFADHLIISVKDSLVAINFLVEAEDGSLSRKNKADK